MAHDALLGQDPRVPQLCPVCSGRRHTRLSDAAPCGTVHPVHKDSVCFPTGQHWAEGSGAGRGLPP